MWSSKALQFSHHQQFLFNISIKKISPINYHVPRKYSTILRNGHLVSKRHILYAFPNDLKLVSFMSTNEINDKYHVVITDPAKLSTNNAVSNAVDTSEAALNTTTLSSAPASSVVDLADPAVTLTSETATAATQLADSAVTLTSETATAAAELADSAVTLTSETAIAATQFAEPTLASLDLAHWTPVGLVEMMLEYMHISWQMPWWMAIATSTVIARIVLLPVLIKTQKNAINMSNYMPQMQFLQAKFQEARKSGNHMEASRCAANLVDFMKRHNISPLKNAMMPLLQAPVFLSFFLALRAMAKTPVQSMCYGGLGWTTDLTIPDPYYILPLVSCSTLYVVIKVGAESGVKLENMKMMRYVVQAIPVIALPFCIHFPSAVLYYWVTTNFCTLAIVSVLKIKPVRRLLDMPTQQPANPDFAMPKKGFMDGMKEAFEDQKVLSAIEERRKMDEIRFLKAGTGPVPRTYSYDPTKPKPSNIAASASKESYMASVKKAKSL